MTTHGVVLAMTLATGLTAGVLVTPAAPAPAGAARAPARPAPADAITVRGVIRSVTPTQLVLVGTGAAAETMLSMDERTVFERFGKHLTVADLKAGDPVTVTYAVRGGKPLASRVWVRQGAGDPGGAPAAKKK